MNKHPPPPISVLVTSLVTSRNFLPCSEDVMERGCYLRFIPAQIDVVLNSIQAVLLVKYIFQYIFSYLSKISGNTFP